MFSSEFPLGGHFFGIEGCAPVNRPFLFPEKMDKTEMSSESPQHATPQTESPSLSNHQAPDYTGAIRMVPPEEFDGPLNPPEIEMRFGNPVIFNGTDYSKMKKYYSQAVHDQPTDEEFACWESVPLSAYAQRADSSAMEYCQRLLVIHDRLRRQNVSSQTAYEVLKEHHGYMQTDRTLRRQLAHARLALILAAAGRIEMLPSQNTSAVITALLPRHAWVPFFSHSGFTECGAGTMQKKAVEFAERKGIALRGQPAGQCKTTIKSQMLLNESVAELPEKRPGEEPDPAPEEERGANVTEPTDISKCKKLAVKQLAKAIKQELHHSVPAYHMKEPAEFAKVFVQELDGLVKSVPRPSRHAKLDALAVALSRHDPVRARAMEKAALRLLLGQVVDRATDRAGARSGKKVTPDTVCPEAAEAAPEAPDLKEEPFL